MKYILVFSFHIIFCTVVTAQKNDTALARLIVNLRHFYELNPFEKSLLQTDKSFYQPGEALWFSTRLTLRETPSTLSKIVYTDISDEYGTIYHKGMWKAENGYANGNFYLPDTLKTGIYRIRSYSLWMLNQPATISEQYFFVLGKKDLSKSFVAAAAKFNVLFFPEGGQLVAGISNKVAFQLTGEDGLPVQQVSALKITDAEEQTIIASPFFQNGVGFFEFVPEKKKLYLLKIKKNLNVTENFQLPAAADDGIVLKVNNLSPTKLFIGTEATETFINKHKKIIILVQQDGKVAYINEFNLEDQQNATVINKKNLANGLVHVTAFDEKLNPLAERWILNEQSQLSKLTLTTSAANAQPKAVNTFELHFTGTDTPHLSLSVIPADLPMPGFVYPINAENYFYLQSNLKQPRFSLSWNTIPDSLRSLYLDAISLMLHSQGFSWDLIRSDKQSALNYYFETGISIRGMVVKEKETAAFDSSSISIITKGEDSTTIISTAKVNSKGFFAVNDLDFWKRATVYLQGVTKEKKKRKISFSLQPSYIDTLSKISTPFLLKPKLLEEKIISQQQADFIKNYSASNLGKELTEIVIKGKKTSKEDSLSKQYSSELFRNSDFVVVPNENFSYASVWQLLQESIPGLYVSSATANEPMVSFSRYTLSNDRVANGDGSANSVTAVPVAFFLNEIPIEVWEVSMINPADIALIKANRSANVLIGSFAAAAGAEGSIMIYTKKNTGTKLGFEASPLTGYSFSGTFISPDFSRTELKNTEDRRTTLLWQPHVKFDSKGKATIQFYNNDYTKKFKVVVQGIDKSGNLFYLEKTIE
ncbi:MAG: hypothetical protein K2Q24_11180 [Chitinophagaceae bacterium]|nr:hypothetical protein [Chitinophagaceae bacterium]